MRRDRGWSQSQLAEFSGLSLRTIQRIEKGSEPTLESLKALAAVFQVDLAELRNSGVGMNESTITSEEREELVGVRRRTRFLYQLVAFLIVIPLFWLVDWIPDGRLTFAHWLTLAWGIWLALRARALFKSGGLFDAGWERRQLEKRTGRRME